MTIEQAKNLKIGDTVWCYDDYIPPFVLEANVHKIGEFILVDNGEDIWPEQIKDVHLTRVEATAALIAQCRSRIASINKIIVSHGGTP